MIKSRSFLIDARLALGLMVLGALASGPLAAPSAHAGDEAATAAGSGDASPSEREIAESLGKLVFVPHDTGAPAVTEAGGVRAVTVAPRIQLLAPDRLARSLSAAPTLYWHISKAPEGTLRFTLLADDAGAGDPLLEVEIDDIEREGIYGVSLADHGVTLEAGKRYVWSIVPSSGDERDAGDPAARTVLERGTSPALVQALDGAGPHRRAVRLAAEGFWYDAVETLSGEIERGGGDAWRAARARLLDQAGLLQAARHDRR